MIECSKHGLSTTYGKDRKRCSHCNIENVTRRRLKIKQLCVEKMGGQCNLCGYDKYIGALHFHHTDPLTKLYKISDGCTRSFKKIKDELRKCIMLCSNCHAEVHAGLVTDDVLEQSKKHNL